MANLQIKGMDDELYAQIKKLATDENRSISQQVLFVLRSFLARRHRLQQTMSPAQVLLDLAGSWDDERSADQIISDIRQGRVSSTKLTEGF